MKPYYEDQWVKIYHGDCREMLPALPMADLCITDPPFSNTTHKGARSAPIAPYRGEAQAKVAFEAWTPDSVRAVFEAIKYRRWLIATMDWRHVYHLEQQPPKGSRFVRFGVWVKPNSAPQFTGDRPATGWEAVAVFHREGERLAWNGGGHRAVWTHLIDSSGIHPTAKPLGLISQWLSQFAEEGDTIIDPFMGSGSTLRAAKEMSLKAIGIEINEAYCEIAAKRLSQEVFNFEPPRQSEPQSMFQ